MYAKSAEEVVFVNITRSELDVHNACITKHAIHVFQNMPWKKKKV